MFHTKPSATIKKLRADNPEAFADGAWIFDMIYAEESAVAATALIPDGTYYMYSSYITLLEATEQCSWARAKAQGVHLLYAARDDSSSCRWVVLYQPEADQMPSAVDRRFVFKNNQIIFDSYADAGLIAV